MVPFLDLEFERWCYRCWSWSSAMSATSIKLFSKKSLFTVSSLFTSPFLIDSCIAFNYIYSKGFGEGSRRGDYSPLLEDLYGDILPVPASKDYLGLPLGDSFGDYGRGDRAVGERCRGEFEPKKYSLIFYLMLVFARSLNS